MSKAEERAIERYWLEPNNIEIQKKYAAYVEGYHQAEKDLELTWENIEKVCLIAREIHQFRGFWSESVYQEVLKRFNKERKEK